MNPLFCIVDCVFGPAGFSVKHCDNSRRMIHHPFIPNLEARATIPGANELHDICLAHNGIVSPFPLIAPAALESLERAGTDKMDRFVFVPKPENYLCSPYIDSTSHAGNERDEAIVNGFSDFRLKPGDDLRLGHIQFFRAMPGETASVLSFFLFSQLNHLANILYSCRRYQSSCVYFRTDYL